MVARCYRPLCNVCVVVAAKVGEDNIWGGASVSGVIGWVVWTCVAEFRSG